MSVTAEKGLMFIGKSCRSSQKGVDHEMDGEPRGMTEQVTRARRKLKIYDAIHQLERGQKNSLREALNPHPPPCSLSSYPLVQPTMFLLQLASLYVDLYKTLKAHISVDTGVPQLNFGVGASLPMDYLPTKSLSETPDFLETLPL